MPDPTIRITIEYIYYTAHGRAVGTGEGTIQATVNDGSRNIAIGDATRISNYRADRRVRCDWHTDLNVRGKDSLEFNVVCADRAGTRIARFQYRLNRPWRMFEHQVSSTRNAHLVWSVSPRFGIQQQSRLVPYAVSASREHHGSVRYTTVAGRRGNFRLEVCPIRPVPPDLQLPPRPLTIDFEMLLGNNPAWRNGLGREVRANDPINLFPNPAVIPMLDPPAADGDARPSEAELDNAATANQRNCARLECSFYWPESERFTDNDRRLEWRKLSGASNIAFIKYNTSDPDGTENRGLKVMAYGTTEGEVVLGVHFNNTVVSRYRALVHPIKRLECRFNIFNGPQGPAGARSRFTPPSTPDHVLMHREIANRYLRQVGVMLVPDTNNSLTWANGRTVSRSTHNGIFRIRVRGNETREISDDDSEELIRYNGRRNILNFFYVRSHDQGAGGAAVFWPHSKLGNAAGTIDDTGTPSSSWIRPSGNAPDNAAGTVRLRYIRGWPPPNDAAHRQRHGMFITAAMGADPGGIDAMDYGVAIAHEVGHMMNLGHRVETISDPGLRNQWNVGTLAPAANAGGRIPQLQNGAGNLGADDGVWCDELWYPRLQNVMRWLADAYFNQTFDILQARVVQQSPLLD